MRLRMTYTNWPTVRSDGTRYLCVCEELSTGVGWSSTTTAAGEGEQVCTGLVSSCINKLVSCSQLLGNSLLFVNVGDVALLGLLHNDLEHACATAAKSGPPTSALALPGSLLPLPVQGDWPYRDPVWVLVANAGSLGLALLCKADEVHQQRHNADQCQDAPRAGEGVTSQPSLLMSTTDRGITQRVLVLETTGLHGHPGYYEAHKGVADRWDDWFAGNGRLLRLQKGAKDLGGKTLQETDFQDARATQNDEERCLECSNAPRIAYGAHFFPSQNRELGFSNEESREGGNGRKPFQ